MTPQSAESLPAGSLTAWMREPCQTVRRTFAGRAQPCSPHPRGISGRGWGTEIFPSLSLTPFDRRGGHRARRSSERSIWSRQIRSSSFSDTVPSRGRGTRSSASSSCGANWTPRTRHAPGRKETLPERGVRQHATERAFHIRLTHRSSSVRACSLRRHPARPMAGSRTISGRQAHTSRPHGRRAAALDDARIRPT